MALQTPLAPFVGNRSPRVLVVDDEPVNLTVFSKILDRWGCVVHTAGNGAEARAAATSFAPDVILLDILMPGESGFDVCTALQADPRTQHIPVIYLTGLTDDTSKVRGFETGGHDYVSKPVNFTELAARLGARLREKYALDALRVRIEDVGGYAADALTGLLTGESFVAAAGEALEEIATSRLPYSVILLDVDGFQAINDDQGHTAGDRALRLVAQVIQATRRRTDLVARRGGDEFVLLLPATTEQEARTLAEAIRRRAGRSDITLSGGGITLPTPHPGLMPSAAHLLERAAKALAEAKGAGGNRIEWA